MDMGTRRAGEVDQARAGNQGGSLASGCLTSGRSGFKNGADMPAYVPTSEVLQNSYAWNWTKRTIVECGAARNGQEISALSAENACWFIEADPDYFRELSAHTRGIRTLHYALTDYDGEIDFQQSS